MIDVISFWAAYSFVSYLTFFIIIVGLAFFGSVWLDKVTNNDFKLVDKFEKTLFKITPFKADNGGGMFALVVISVVMFAISSISNIINNFAGLPVHSYHDFIKIVSEFIMPCGIYLAIAFVVWLATNYLSKAYIKFKGFKRKLDKL